MIGEMCAQVSRPDSSVAAFINAGLPIQGSAGRVLVVDDEPQQVALLTMLLRRVGYDVVTALDGELALDAMKANSPDVVILDINMPKLDGFAVCKSIKADPTTRLVPVILLTGSTSTDYHLKGIDAGADDFIAKPFAARELEARVRSLVQLKRYTDGLDSAESVILSLALTIEARDPYTRFHCERLADHATAFGRHLGLDDDSCRTLQRGGFLHDVGKIGIPDAVFLKAGPLTASELTLMQQHPVIGDGLCRELRSLQDVRPIVRHHHERADGTGYPDRLKGDEIPLVAQMIAIVDGYDAMTTDRPYRAARTASEAFAELRGDVGKGWKNAALVDAFVSMMTQLKRAAA